MVLRSQARQPAGPLFVDEENRERRRRNGAQNDDGKKSEKVVIHKAGPDYYATRADDAGAAKLPTTAVDDAIKALDAAK